ncbi:MAG: hypothetical protein ABW208_19940 [Pyrinomonadaceae bacterium]
MNTKTENLMPVQFSQVNDEETARQAERATDKKQFVEPVVSFPIDVLEATTFFQLTDSGSTT